MKNSTKVKKIARFAVAIILATVLMSLSHANINANESEPVLVSTWGELQTAVATASGATTIELANDISTTVMLTIPANAEITLIGDYSLILTGNFPVMTVNGNFTLDGPRITRTEERTANGRGVVVNSGGILTMESGEISGHSIQNGGGGGVYVGGAFIMRGGEIRGNATWNNGGGIQVVGTFAMYGGEIKGNQSGSDGGGLYVSPGGSVTKRGGRIIENTSTRNAGGVYLFTGEFIMHGGEISGNNVNALNGRGGGVVVYYDSKFTMHGGEISGHNVRNGGGGVDVSSNSEFTMRGGVISGNTSTGSAGGVNVIFNSYFTMYDGKIIKNATGNDGGGIYGQNSNFVMHGGVISKNEAGRNGGGVFFSNGCTVDIQGGRICCNTAGNNGGGIFAWSYTTLTVSSDVIFSGNTANSAHDFFLSASYPDPISIAESGGGNGGSAENIQWGNVSITGTHALNNYDINFVGQSIATQTVTFNPNTGVFIGRELLPTRLVLNNSGALNVDAFYNLVFDENGNLLNKPLPRPTKVGYDFDGWFDTQENADGTDQTGRVLITDRVTSDSERTLWARWTREPAPGGNGSGNNGGIDLPPPAPPTPPIPQPIFSRQAYLIGFDDGLVRPNANITRAEVATIFFRLLTDEQRANFWTQQNPFSDVNLENWFNNAVSTMTNADIFNGFPNGSFAPNNATTRAEMAAIIVRFMDKAGEMYLQENYFSDISGHWASGYINIAATNGWVSGPHGMGSVFYPDQFITRAEAAAMVNRIFGRLQERTENLLPDMRTWIDNQNVHAWYYFYIQSATNSYTFEWRGINDTFERWLTIIPTRNWVELERPPA